MKRWLTIVAILGFLVTAPAGAQDSPLPAPEPTQGVEAPAQWLEPPAQWLEPLEFLEAPAKVYASCGEMDCSYDEECRQECPRARNAYCNADSYCVYDSGGGGSGGGSPGDDD